MRPVGFPIFCLIAASSPESGNVTTVIGVGVFVGVFVKVGPPGVIVYVAVEVSFGVGVGVNVGIIPTEVGV